MDYALVKALHILSGMLLFGTGIGTAYFMWSAHRSRDPRLVAAVARQVVRADWLFTAPSVIVQPLSGWWLAQAVGYSWTGWVAISTALYGLAALCWLPVVWLQMRMRDLSARAVCDGQPLGTAYRRCATAWFWLGVPAFAAMLVVVFLMVLKAP